MDKMIEEDGRKKVSDDMWTIIKSKYVVGSDTIARNKSILDFSVQKLLNYKALIKE